MNHIQRKTKRHMAMIKTVTLFTAVLLLGYFVFVYHPTVNFWSQLKFSSRTRFFKSKCTKEATVENFVADRWIIVTTINGPTEDLRRLSTIPGWKLLVVGDRKTPSDWKMPGVEFLSIDKQYKMGYNILTHLPEGSYTRKMTGYLYAIQHGAKIIYETDDDNSPWPKLDFSSFILTPEFKGYMVDSPPGPYNPLPHFGQSSIWPRGHPLENVSTPAPRRYHEVVMKTPPVQQGVVNGDPDVDAVFRLTRKHESTRLNVTFDIHAPAIVIPEGSLTSYNCQNTLFHYEAFWSLFLPPSRTFRVLDIWRAYWAQRLMWLVGQNLLYIPPSAYQFRSPHDFLQDFNKEIQLYQDSGRLLKFLISWSCDEKEFYSCVSKLSHDMATEKFWDESDAELVDAWLEDLQDVCYQQPKIYRGVKKDYSKLKSLVFYPEEQKTSVQNNPKTVVLQPDKS